MHSLIITFNRWNPSCMNSTVHFICPLRLCSIMRFSPRGKKRKCERGLKMALWHGFRSHETSKFVFCANFVQYLKLTTVSKFSPENIWWCKAGIRVHWVAFIETVYSSWFRLTVVANPLLSNGSHCLLCVCLLLNAIGAPDSLGWVLYCLICPSNVFIWEMSSFCLLGPKAAKSLHCNSLQTIPLHSLSTSCLTSYWYPAYFILPCILSFYYDMYSECHFTMICTNDMILWYVLMCFLISCFDGAFSLYYYILTCISTYHCLQ